MTSHNEPPHLNLQCLSSRFWFWCFMWWAWELSYSVFRIILFLIFLFIVFHNWTGHFIVTPDHLFHLLNHKYLDTKIIDIIVWKSDQHVSSMHTCTCHVQIKCQTVKTIIRLLLIWVCTVCSGISVPIFGVNTMSYLAASVTNTTIYWSKYIVVIQNRFAPGQLASLGLSSSPLLIKKSIWPHWPKKAW